MQVILSQSAPIIGLVVLGFLLRRVGIVHAADGHVLTRLIINVTLPPVIFLSLVRAQLELRTLVVLALVGAAIPLVLSLVAMLVARGMKLESPVAGVVVLSASVTNIGFFLLPFVQVIYGAEGLSRLVAYEVGNSLMANSYAFYLASRYGAGKDWAWSTCLKKIVALPLVWASILGVTVNLAGVRLPDLLIRLLDPLAAANIPLAMLTLGSFVELRFPHWKPMLVGVGLRVGGGWALGQALILALGLQGLERTVVGLGAAMPIGMLVLIYSSLMGLSVELAASTISLSILVALLITPLLLLLY